MEVLGVAWLRGMEVVRYSQLLWWQHQVCLAGDMPTTSSGFNDNGLELVQRSIRNWEFSCGRFFNIVRPYHAKLLSACPTEILISMCVPNWGRQNGQGLTTSEPSFLKYINVSLKYPTCLHTQIAMSRSNGNLSASSPCTPVDLRRDLVLIQLPRWLMSLSFVLEGGVVGVCKS